MIKINILAKDYVLDMELQYKLTIVNSLSGTGKTSMGKYIKDALNNNSTKILVNEKSSKNVVYINEHNKRELISDCLEENLILILDELDFRHWEPSDTNLYNKLYSKKIVKKTTSPYIMAVNNSKAIIVAMQRNEKIGTSVPISAIYNFKKNGKKHWIEPKYVLKPLSKRNVYDVIITEDKYSGMYLMSSLYDNVVSANGKDNVANKLVEVVRKNKYKSIYLFVDTCAFGNCAENLYKVIDELTPIQVKIANIESVEYLLLNSNMFSHINIPEDKTKLPVLFERYYTKILSDELLKHTGTEYSKGIKSKCLYENCCHTYDEKLENCGLYLSGNKLQTMFNGTKFEDILHLNMQN